MKKLISALCTHCTQLPQQRLQLIPISKVVFLQHNRIMKLPKVDPVFVKAGEIPAFKTLKEYELCEAVCKQIKKDSLMCVQRIGMLWQIYLKIKETRVTVLSNKVEIRDQCVNVFTNNPLRARLATGETDQCYESHN